MELKDILERAIKENASDLFIRVKSPVKARIYGDVEIFQDMVVDNADMENILNELLAKSGLEVFYKDRAYEFTFWYRDKWRFRVGAFFQRNTPALVMRKICLDIPTFQELNLPEEVFKKMANEKRGLILFTGITGSGKSTAIASLIEYINQNFRKHILTIEEPIEFTFQDKLSIVNQREIGKDVHSYSDGLKQFALHSPDVIFIGNIRDMETCYAALSAAETGVLVISTLHTLNATSTIERIINFFPAYQHSFLLTQLSNLLKYVFSLRLIPKKDKSGVIPAYEIFSLSPSISRLIRENKLWEIPRYIRDGKIYGMNDFNQCLISLVGKDIITPQQALLFSDRREDLEIELRNLRYEV